MGQRTNIILQVKYRDEKWNETIEETRIFHCQWGIGRILPKNVMSILHNMQSSDLYRKGAAARLCPGGLWDATDEWEMKQDELNALSFDDPSKVGEVMHAANNNGGIFLRLTETCNSKKLERTTTVEYAFMLGYEEGGNYKKFVSKDKFLEKQSRYIDEDFRKMLDMTLDYYEAQDMAAIEDKSPADKLRTIMRKQIDEK
ncbi:MAG: hypothetical protein IJ588_02410 [Prevotella sp.]|nr:hypothetical protein [Prevotella sp.]